MQEKWEFSTDLNNLSNVVKIEKGFRSSFNKEKKSKNKIIKDKVILISLTTLR